MSSVTTALMLPMVEGFLSCAPENDLSNRGAVCRLTGPHDHFGTPFYMAPEQLGDGQGQPDERTDVYDLGAVLCACLTGRPPDGDNLDAKLLKLVQVLVQGE